MLFNKNLQKDEYLRLLEAANKVGNKRIALIIETIGATGIRVSELKYITMEAVSNGIARIHLKGKIRTILLPGKLRTKLLKYARKRKIASGEIFITKSGKSISRKQIWAEMKALCEMANVEKSKVSAQFKAFVREAVLQSNTRYCKTCGLARTQHDRDNSHLSVDHGIRAFEATEQPWTRPIGQNEYFVDEEQLNRMDLCLLSVYGASSDSHKAAREQGRAVKISSSVLFACLIIGNYFAIGIFFAM